MSSSDLWLVLGAAWRWASSHAPSLDLGMLLTVLGALILGSLALYYTAKALIRVLRWIAGLTPEGFTKLLLVVGILLLVAGAVAP